jgi:hypothetical protein
MTSEQKKILHSFKDASLSARPLLLWFGLIFVINIPSIALGENATPSSVYFGLDTMAPENSWAIRLEQRTNHWDHEYDNNGHLLDIDNAFNDLNLDANIFPSIALLGAGASLGTTQFNTQTSSQISVITIGYGLSPDITIGAIIPYGQTKNNVDFAVSGGNVGFNPLFNASDPIGLANFPLGPVGPGVSAMSSSGVQQILTNPAFGYQYKPIKNSQQTGFSDPTLGVLWRAYKTKQESLILGLGLRLGLAKKDDPDDLLDVPLGDGSTDIRTRMEYFRDLAGNFDLHVLADYNIQTADQATLRIPQQGELLALSSSKEKLHRNLGNFYETDLELGYRYSNWRFSTTWHRYEKQSDHYRSKLGTDTTSVEADTYTRADQYRISAAWSGISAWQQGKLPLPLIVKLEMQDTFAGKNFVDVRDFYLQVMMLLK